MSEEFEASEGQEPIERVEDSQEMGELSQMTEDPQAHVEAILEIEQAEVTEVAFTEVVEAETDVLPIDTPDDAKESGEADALPLPLTDPKSEGEEGGLANEVKRLSPEQLAQQEADTPVIEENSEPLESKMTRLEANGVESLKDRTLEVVNEGAGEVTVKYDGEAFEAIHREHMLKLQLLMDKKDQAEKTFSNVITAFTNTQRDLVANLK